MEERLFELLRLAVEEFIASAQPVGSQSLVHTYKLDMSPATVRNWFAELEDRGLLMQPHTSGGRIPTEHGFKTYIQMHVRPRAVSRRDREWLEQALAATDEDGRRLKNVAKALAELSGLAVVLGTNVADTYYTGLSQLFAQPEFVASERVISLSEILDHLDETLVRVRKDAPQTPTILIGRDCPFGPACGVIMMNVPQGMIGILGPMRMHYIQGLSLMQNLHTLLSSRL